MAMKRECVLTGESFEVSDKDLEFYDLMETPPPQLSPLERQRRRTLFRNFRHLYHRGCSATGEKLISMYREDQPFPVFSTEYWWSEKWDPKAYGLEYDHARPFFEQYAELSSRTPRQALLNLNSENSAYCNACADSKNCYLVFGSVRNEDCLYGHIVWDCQQCVDTLYAFRSQWCSNSIDLVDCYDVHYSTEVTNCRESYFLHDCRNCTNCFGSVNLRNAQYYWMNEQLSAGEYRARIKQGFPLTREKVAEVSAWLSQQRQESAVYPESFESKTEDCSGNHLYESQGLTACFDLKCSEDSAYCYTGFAVQHSRDISFTGSGARFSQDSLTLFNAERVQFSQHVQDSSEIAYSEFCYSSRDLFGCNGLRRSQYCILNRQYQKDDYFQLRGKIVQEMRALGDWGEFFPSWVSPFAYNESIAQEYQPLKKSEVERRGLRWKDEPVYPSPPSGAEVSPVWETVSAQKTYYCKATNKPFRLSEAEIAFLGRMGLPLPDLSFDERFGRRLRSRPQRRLQRAACSVCRKPLDSAHFECTSRVACSTCYLRALERS